MGGLRDVLGGKLEPNQLKRRADRVHDQRTQEQLPDDDARQGKSEDFTRVAVVFAGLADLMDKSAARIAAAADIPLTRFLGSSPGGLNATGESRPEELLPDAWRAMRERLLPKPLRMLDEVIARDAGLPEPLEYEWPSLLEMSEQEQAEVKKHRGGGRTLQGAGVGDMADARCRGRGPSAHEHLDKSDDFLRPARRGAGACRSRSRCQDRAGQDQGMADRNPRPIRPRVKDERAYLASLRSNYLRPMFQRLVNRLARVVAAAEAMAEAEAALIEWQAQQGAGVPQDQIAYHLESVRAYHRQQLYRSWRSALGIDIRPLLQEGRIAAHMAEAIRANVDLVKTIPPRMHDRLREKIAETFAEQPFDQQALRELLRDQFRSTGYDLRRLTRDQNEQAGGQPDGDSADGAGHPGVPVAHVAG